VQTLRLTRNGDHHKSIRTGGALTGPGVPNPSRRACGHQANRSRRTASFRYLLLLFPPPGRGPV